MGTQTIKSYVAMITVIFILDDEVYWHLAGIFENGCSSRRDITSSDF